ncbi:hypothetical protein [Cryptosporangium sp. NPDC051539]|uniref:hypothetical protein n=1 Tax=Cryptosporangium sp. NPDC051539 TaxID=3363962 RepID=UPI00378D1F6D
MVLVFGGATAVSIGVSSAGERPAVQSAAPKEDCGGLDQALKNNLNFIADQRRNPDSLSDARIANRQAVVDLIQQRRVVAECTANVVADGDAADGDAAAAPAADPTTAAPAAPAAPAGGSGDGEVVCQGSTVTLSGEDGAPAASSNQFPVGTQLRVTNLDNDKSITVQVTGASGSCALLNDAAFEQVREPGKFLIRRAVIERVG